MAATPSSDPKSSGEGPSATATPLPLSFEDKMNQFWTKNKGVIIGLCVVVLALIVGEKVWQMVRENREAEVAAAYAKAATTEQLRAFAKAHSGHVLAGVAELRIADEAYAGSRYGDAAAGYDKALAALKDGPLAARARVGRALANVQAGKGGEGEAELKQLFNDASQLDPVRLEAGYHLAGLAADAGNTADVQKYVEQLTQIDPASIWTRRAQSLQTSLPKPAAQAGGPALSLPTK